jgi:ABC-type sugar transport system substrate-binding protein
VKKFLTILLTLVLVLSLFGCSTKTSGEVSSTGGETTGGESTGGESSGDGGTYEITVNGVTYTTDVDPKSVSIACSVYQQDAHQSLLRQATIDCAKAYGVNCITTVVDSDVSKELEFLSTCVSSGTDGYIWAPCGTASIVPLIEAQESGAYVAIINGLTKSETYPEPWVLFSGNFYNSNESMCETLGKEVKAPLEKVFADEIASGKKLKVGIIAFDALSKEISDVRANATLDQLTALGLEYEVVSRQDAVEQDKAIEVSTDMLTANPDLDLFVSCCESASIGAIMTVANEGLQGSCYVAGIDTSVQIAKLMKDYPEIGLAFVGQSSYISGWNAAEQVIRLCLGIEKETTAAQFGKENIQPDMILNMLDEDGIQAYIDEMAALGVTG